MGLSAHQWSISSRHSHISKSLAFAIAALNASANCSLSDCDASAKRNLPLGRCACYSMDGGGRRTDQPEIRGVRMQDWHEPSSWAPAVGAVPGTRATTLSGDGVRKSAVGTSPRTPEPISRTSLELGSGSEGDVT